ncbi:hypothetical protein LCGC14_2363170, partial [marine sediment metagenome]
MAQTHYVNAFRGQRKCQFGDLISSPHRNSSNSSALMRVLTMNIISRVEYYQVLN